MRRWINYCAAAALLAGVGGLHAGIVTYVNNPTGNSFDFAGGVAGNGGGPITTLTFDDQLTGALNPAAYSGLGVTLTATGPFAVIVNGTGPADGGIGLPLSPGEGPHAASNYLGDRSSTVGSLTVTFASPVLAAGIFTIDLFNPGGVGDVFTVSAYTGPGGTGAFLGSVAAAGFSFQNDNLYFMGILSTAADIGSVVLSQNGSSSGDHIGLDNVEFAANAPEPGALALVGLGLLAIARKVRSSRA